MLKCTQKIQPTYMTLPILLSFLGRHFGKTPAVGVVSTLSWSMRIDILVSSPWIQERHDVF